MLKYTIPKWHSIILLLEIIIILPFKWAELGSLLYQSDDCISPLFNRIALNILNLNDFSIYPTKIFDWHDSCWLKNKI